MPAAATCPRWLPLEAAATLMVWLRPRCTTVPDRPGEPLDYSDSAQPVRSSRTVRLYPPGSQC
jgi:hypothetical protein